MIVIKLGGSLSQAETLLSCLNRIEQHYKDQAVVIVPGGGAFADQVRLAQVRWQFDDTTAHRMAILAMQQMALLIHGLKNQFTIVHSSTDILKRIKQGEALIWSPMIDELDKASVPASWDMTSDSLAAWLAKTVSAQALILVKSAIIDNKLTLEQLAEQQIIDQGFCQLVATATFTVNIISQHDF
ncbi:MAG: uridylate kinase [Methylococcales bacterium]|nr:MAG: uridylate kinase [Methylococcales bacterium]